MIKWIKGAAIHDSDMLLEGYRIENNSIVSVLHADNIIKVITSYVQFYSKYPFFFFLEVPCRAQEEEKLHSDDGKLHRNVYYLDNIGADEVLKYLKIFEDILVNDGLTAFGIGNHESEIGK
ncbi:MAG: hypothetical protein Q4G07_09370, partial [Oscillospiraceae bacterium]|nr:hypothetical protein [Oscillospiraceae bacterium]